MTKQTICKCFALISLLFLSSTLLFATVTSKARLRIHILDSRDTIHSVYLKELQIEKDGVLYALLKPEHTSIQHLRRLTYGTYTLIYENIFDQKVRMNVSITESKIYLVNVYTNYIDYSEETDTTVIDRLRVNEHFELIIESRGCMNFKTDTITISRAEDAYTILWPPKAKRLTTSDIDLIRNFLTELFYINGLGSCTNHNLYVIRYTTEPIFFIENTCDWEGDYYLKKQLFGEK